MRKEQIGELRQLVGMLGRTIQSQPLLSNDETNALFDVVMEYSSIHIRRFLAMAEQASLLCSFGLTKTLKITQKEELLFQVFQILHNLFSDRLKVNGEGSQTKSSSTL